LRAFSFLPLLFLTLFTFTDKGLFYKMSDDDQTINLVVGKLQDIANDVVSERQENEKLVDDLNIILENIEDSYVNYKIVDYKYIDQLYELRERLATKLLKE
jgi:hypothetical protein